jgi:hypothetical protein
MVFPPTPVFRAPESGIPSSSGLAIFTPLSIEASRRKYESEQTPLLVSFTNRDAGLGMAAARMPAQSRRNRADVLLNQAPPGGDRNFSVRADGGM